MKLNNFPLITKTEEQVVKDVISFVKERKKTIIVTLNTEMLMTSLNDKKLEKIYKSSYNVPDSIGLVIASEYQAGPKRMYPFSWLKITLIGLKIIFRRELKGDLKKVIPGVDLCYLLAKTCAQEGFKLFLLGGEKTSAETAASRLIDKFTNLQVEGSFGGLVGEDDKKMVEAINAFSPDIIFIGFGHGKQEKWLAENLKKLNASIGVGVGGSLEYISGTTKRAPLWLRKSGLEWSYRLFTQPWRIKRQLALVKFLDLLARN